MSAKKARFTIKECYILTFVFNKAGMLRSRRKNTFASGLTGVMQACILKIGR
jgi:hypothetical protein